MRLQEFRLEITDCLQCPSIIEVDARVITLQEVQHSQVIKEVRIGGGLKGRAVQSIFLGAQRPQPPSPLPTYTGPQARQANTIITIFKVCQHATTSLTMRTPYTSLMLVLLHYLDVSWRS